jgi:hypothetical protein
VLDAPIPNAIEANPNKHVSLPEDLAHLESASGLSDQQPLNNRSVEGAYPEGEVKCQTLMDHGHDFSKKVQDVVKEAAETVPLISPAEAAHGVLERRAESHGGGRPSGGDVPDETPAALRTENEVPVRSERDRKREREEGRPHRLWKAAFRY